MQQKLSANSFNNSASVSFQVDDPVSDNECDCDGQLWVAPDCKSGFSCDADREGGGLFWECTEPGEIIDVDVRTWNWGCKPDNGNCPAGGGFSLGCESGPVRVPTEGVAMQVGVRRIRFAYNNSRKI